MDLTPDVPPDLAPDRERLERLLGGPDLAWLRDRLRQRLERGLPLDRPVTLTDATDAQRRAVQRLLGRAPRAGSAVGVTPSVVDEVLRRSGAWPGGLASAVVTLTGPITLRSDAKQAAERAWSEAFAPMQAVVDRRPELAAWWELVCSSGLVRRLAREPSVARPLMADLAAAVAPLPVDGEPIGAFAARVLADAHALDDDRPLATLTLGAARAITGLPAGSGAGWRREVWAAVGLLRDELSTTVLALGLPGDTASATGRALGAWAEAGQPVSLTLRQLVRDPPHLNVAGATASVCENPVVLAAAAERLGDGCPPLVCTSGQPGVAVMTLLRLLVAAGGRLRHHGDFDWGGLSIGNVLHARLPMTPWRFDAAAYRRAVSGSRGRPLTGAPVAASWDPELARAMRETGLRVEEELVLDDLISDLSATT